jgi:hypothetical protein
VPALAVFAVPHDLGRWIKDDPVVSAEIEATPFLRACIKEAHLYPNTLIYRTEAPRSVRRASGSFWLAYIRQVAGVKSHYPSATDPDTAA